MVVRAKDNGLPTCELFHATRYAGVSVCCLYRKEDGDVVWFNKATEQQWCRCHLFGPFFVLCMSRTTREQMPLLGTVTAKHDRAEKPPSTKKRKVSEPFVVVSSSSDSDGVVTHRKSRKTTNRKG